MTGSWHHLFWVYLQYTISPDLADLPREKGLMEVCLFQLFSFLLWIQSLWIFWILPSFSKHILLGKADFIEVMTNLQTLCGYYVCIYITTYWAARYFMACKDSWDFHICNLVTVETKCMPKNWDFFTNYILNCSYEIFILFLFHSVNSIPHDWANHIFFL